MSLDNLTRVVWVLQEMELKRYRGWSDILMYFTVVIQGQAGCSELLR